VLKFGHGASQTYSDLTFMVSMGIHLDPDACIFLNGFNDAFFATESSRIFTDSNYVINWSDFSYYYHDAINGLAAPRPVTLLFMPFMSMLFNDIMAERHATAGPAKEVFRQMPMRLVTKELEKTDPLHD